MVPFFSQSRVPAHSVLLMNSRRSATEYPRGDIELAHCPECGLVANIRFDPALNEYSRNYEATQHLSATFCTFARRLVDRLVSHYGIRSKRVVDIGCGKGEFLALLCAAGDNHGLGIDPACTMDRLPVNVRDRIELVADFFKPEQCPPDVDLISCRHTLEHIPSVAAFLRDVRRAAGPATLFLLEVPDAEIVLRENRFWDIYYEHCSYFSSGSLCELVRREGFEVLECQRDFDDQYLWLVAKPTSLPRSSRHFSPERDDLIDLVPTFDDAVQSSIWRWRKMVDDQFREKATVTIWGAGSKCVSFLTATRMGRQIGYVVDINPRKQGKFLPGSGHEVISPNQLAARRPDTVLVMNPIYLEEVRATLANLDLAPRLIPVC
jgi:SAM-dependent methyltransferase